MIGHKLGIVGRAQRGLNRCIFGQSVQKNRVRPCNTFYLLLLFDWLWLCNCWFVQGIESGAELVVGMDLMFDKCVFEWIRGL